MANWINTYVHFDCNSETYKDIVEFTKKNGDTFNYLVKDTEGARIWIASKTSNPADYLNALEKNYSNVNFYGSSLLEGCDEFLRFEYKDGKDKVWDDIIKE